MVKSYYQYADDIIAGKITACNYIIMACKRFKNDLQREDLVFKEDVVDKAIKFISILKHYQSGHAGSNFILSSWQAFIVANIVGLYYKKTNLRKYSSSYIEVARKQGKSALASALCIYFLIADGEKGAEVLLAANSKEQARIAFEMCYQFTHQLDPLGKMLRKYRSEIKFSTTQSVLKVLAADDSKLDGFNCSFGLIDEYHSAKNSRVRDVIKSSMGMRENPHLCTITTAGFNKSLPCYALRETAIEVLQGAKQDDSMFVAIYSIEENEDWKNPKCWIKSNPNLGVTVKPAYIASQIQQALNNPSDYIGVLTKNLNIWCDTVEVWIPEDTIIRNTASVDIPANTIVTVGVDLASVGDLTAVAFLYYDDDRYYCKLKYYLPASALQSGINKDMYLAWQKQGYLTVTQGNVTDYDYITKDILQITKGATINCIYYDAFNATQWAIDCTAQGLPLEDYPQNIANFNKPTRELERLILSDRIVIDDNPITRYCFRNVVLKSDHNGNVKPIKGVARSRKIDGVIALIEALGGYLATDKYSNEIIVI